MSRYLANKLMAHGFLLERQALRSPPLATPRCLREPHSVLAPFSRRYPQLKGRLPMHYSPFRHSHGICIATSADPVRLACLIHATSVRSEPESNSQKKIQHPAGPKSAGTFCSGPLPAQANRIASLPNRRSRELFRFQRTSAACHGRFAPLVSTAIS